MNGLKSFATSRFIWGSSASPVDNEPRPCERRSVWPHWIEHDPQLLTGARPEVRAQLVREKQSIGKEASLRIIKSLFADDPVPVLRRYPGPTLVVVTSHNDQPYDLQRLLPQLPRTMIAGTSHWPHLDKPDEFNRVLDGFLATVK